MLGWELAVPASTANLGAGFDSLAVALQMYLRVKVCEVSPTATNGLSFDLCGMPLSGDNYIERGFRSMAERDRVTFPSLSLEVKSEIPMRGGLGSSAAATVAGLRLYERLTGRGDIDDLLTEATRLDHHADNVAAALLGGLTLSCVTDSGRVIARSIAWPADVQAVVAMPRVEVATPEARKVLPAAYPLEDAVFNLQRALLFVHAIERREYSRAAGSHARSLAPAAAGDHHPRPRERARPRSSPSDRRVSQRVRPCRGGVRHRWL